MVLNLFSTLLMLRLGRVHDGLMVDMRASNEKLRARTVRMLRHLTGADTPAARAALADAHGSIKLATLLLHGLDAAAARALLARTDGNLRAALAGIGRAGTDIDTVNIDATAPSPPAATTGP